VYVALTDANFVPLVSTRAVPPAVDIAFNVPPFSDEPYFVGLAEDLNDDGTIQPNEVVRNPTTTVRIVSRSKSQAATLAYRPTSVVASAALLGIDSSVLLTSLGLTDAQLTSALPIAASFWNAYLFDHPVSGALVGGWPLQPNEIGLDFNIGAVFINDSSHTPPVYAPIVRNIFSASSSSTIYTNIMKSSALHDAVNQTMINKRSLINQLLSGASVGDIRVATTRLVGNKGQTDTIEFPHDVATALRSIDDFDLGMAFGSARLDAGLRFTVRRTTSGFTLVDAEVISGAIAPADFAAGTIDDLYDFGSGDAVPMQAGYLAPGDGGHVFKTTVSIVGIVQGVGGLNY
jgi:hypothetical protein